MADYAHGSGYDGRSDHSVSSALTTPWPTSFDINTDILKQDKAATFRREFKAAVRSRKLLEAVETVLPTIAEVVAENPGVEKALIMEHYDKLCDRRRNDLATVADQAIKSIKWDSLMQSEKNALNRMGAAGDGAGVYAWIMEASDLKSGRAHGGDSQGGLERHQGEGEEQDRRAQGRGRRLARRQHDPRGRRR